MTPEQQLASLSARLLEITVNNTANAIFDKIQTAKAKRNDKEIIRELEGIISSLIDDKTKLIQIAQAYEQETIAQKISKEDIIYITDQLVPTIRQVFTKLSKSSDDKGSQQIQEMMELLTPLLSVELLTVMQLIGFNYKKAIGEPLTKVLKNLIESKAQISPETNAEFNILSLKNNIATLELALDQSAFERFQSLQNRPN